MVVVVVVDGVVVGVTISLYVNLQKLVRPGVRFQVLSHKVASELRQLAITGFGALTRPCFNILTSFF